MNAWVDGRPDDGDGHNTSNLSDEVKWQMLNFVQMSSKMTVATDNHGPIWIPTAEKSKQR